MTLEAFALKGSGLPLRTSAHAGGASLPAQRYAFTLPPRRPPRPAQTRIYLPGVDLSPLEPQAPVAAEVQADARRRPAARSEVTRAVRATAVSPQGEATPRIVQMTPVHTEHRSEKVVVRMEKTMVPDTLPRPFEPAREPAQAAVPSHDRERIAAPEPKTTILKVEAPTIATPMQTRGIERERTHRVLERVPTQALAPHGFDGQRGVRIPESAGVQQVVVELGQGPEGVRESLRIEEVHGAPRVKKVAQTHIVMGIPERSALTTQTATPATAHPVVERIAAATAPKEEKAVRIGSVQVTVRSPAPAPVAAPGMPAPLAPAAHATAARSAFRNPWLSRNRQD